MLDFPVWVLVALVVIGILGLIVVAMVGLFIMMLGPMGRYTLIKLLAEKNTKSDEVRVCQKCGSTQIIEMKEPQMVKEEVCNRAGK